MHDASHCIKAMANHLVQLLLPLADNAGRPFPDTILEGVKETLANRFGGVTAFERSPAQGIWAPDPARKQHDQVVTIEVMVDTVDNTWWKDFRERLERELNQEQIVVRAFPIHAL